MMKKKIVIGMRILIFNFIFIYLFVHISYMCRGDLAHVRGCLSGFYDLDDNSLDVVCVGTSGSFSAYAPMDAYEKYGYTSYNFGINGIGVDSMVYAVREVIKTQKPKVLMIDAYPYVINHHVEKDMEEFAVRYNTDGYKYSLSRFKMISSIVPDEDKLAYYLDIIKYHDNAFEWENFFSEVHSIDKGFGNLGFGVVQEPILTNEKVELDASGDECLTQMLDECKAIQEKYNTNILFIYYPYADIEDRSEYSLEKVNYMSQRVNEYGFDFMNCQNFREDFQLNTSKDYWDNAHFNIYGAEKITSIVASRLKELYDLPDRRNDENYHMWSEDITDWENNKKVYKAKLDDLISQYDFSYDMEGL